MPVSWVRSRCCAFLGRVPVQHRPLLRLRPLPLEARGRLGRGAGLTAAGRTVAGAVVLHAGCGLRGVLDVGEGPPGHRGREQAQVAGAGRVAAAGDGSHVRLTPRRQRPVHPVAGVDGTGGGGVRGIHGRAELAERGRDAEQIAGSDGRGAEHVDVVGAGHHLGRATACVRGQGRADGARAVVAEQPVVKGRQDSACGAGELHHRGLVDAGEGHPHVEPARGARAAHHVRHLRVAEDPDQHAEVLGRLVEVLRGLRVEVERGEPEPSVKVGEIDRPRRRRGSVPCSRELRRVAVRPDRPVRLRDHAVHVPTRRDRTRQRPRIIRHVAKLRHAGKHLGADTSNVSYDDPVPSRTLVGTTRPPG